MLSNHLPGSKVMSGCIFVCSNLISFRDFVKSEFMTVVELLYSYEIENEVCDEAIYCLLISGSQNNSFNQITIDLSEHKLCIKSVDIAGLITEQETLISIPTVLTWFELFLDKVHWYFVQFTIPFNLIYLKTNIFIILF